MKKYLYIVLALVVLGSSACDRYLESRDPVQSVPTDLPVPQNVQLFVNNLSISLSWEIEDASDISLYRIYLSENDTLDYKLKDSTTSLAIDLDNLITNRLYYIKIAAVNSDGLEGYRTDELFTQVGVLSMVIDNNNDFANRQSVQVQFTVVNSATNVQLSEDSTFDGAVYEPFSGQRAFTLSDGDGVKNIYARLLFSNGASNSELLHDSIILDTEARIDSVFFLDPDSVFLSSDTIKFALVANELNGTARASFTGSGNIDLVDDGTGFDPVANDGVYYGWYVAPNNSNVHEATVTGNFTDEAGNNAAALTSFDLININTRPEAVELLVTYTGAPGDSAYFSWTRSDEPDFESYRLYTANTVNITTNSELVTYESNVNTREFAILPPVGTSYYHIYVFDAHGVEQRSDIAVQLIVSP